MSDKPFNDLDKTFEMSGMREKTERNFSVRDTKEHSY